MSDLTPSWDDGKAQLDAMEKAKERYHRKYTYHAGYLTGYIDAMAWVLFGETESEPLETDEEIANDTPFEGMDSTLAEMRSALNEAQERPETRG